MQKKKSANSLLCLDTNETGTMNSHLASSLVVMSNVVFSDLLELYLEVYKRFVVWSM